MYSPSASRVQSRQTENKMGISNLAIVWGPTLVGGSADPTSTFSDMQYQCKVVEVILSNYYVIFDQDE